MLVLTRRAGETIVIDDTVRVMVIERTAGCVRLVAQDPADVPIHRAEAPARRADWPDMPDYAAFGAAVDPSEFPAEADLAP